MIKNNYHHQFQKKNNFIERLEFEPTIKALYKSFLNSILVCDNAFSCLHPRGFIFFYRNYLARSVFTFQ